MKVFAISDLHLSFKDRVIPGEWEKAEEYKPMNIFGDKWEKHYYPSIQKLAKTGGGR